VRGDSRASRRAWRRSPGRALGPSPPVDRLISVTAQLLTSMRMAAGHVRSGSRAGSHPSSVRCAVRRRARCPHELPHFLLLHRRACQRPIRWWTRDSCTKGYRKKENHRPGLAWDVQLACYTPHALATSSSTLTPLVWSSTTNMKEHDDAAPSAETAALPP
jgi:hypothetical protein